MQPSEVTLSSGPPASEIDRQLCRPRSVNQDTAVSAITSDTVAAADFTAGTRDIPDGAETHRTSST
jgi:hypothetical protein